MGYNSWFDFGCTDAMNESSIVATADKMVSFGLRALGYRFVNLDGCWLEEGSKGRDGAGTLQPHARKFGGAVGIRRLADRLHAADMLFGVYTDRGTQTCQGRVGSKGFEAADAKAYAAWHVDYVRRACMRRAGMRFGTRCDRELRLPSALSSPYLPLESCCIASS
eukprot:6212107-Pleurochrysis_carterae.AAC.2